MRRSLHQLLFLSLLSIPGFAQEGKAVYEYSINAVKQSSNGKNGFTDGILYFNDSAFNYYEINPKKNNNGYTANNDGSISILTNDEHLFEHYCNLKTNMSYVKDRIAIDYTNYKRENAVPSWQLAAEKKQIGKYLCQKATTHFSGRDWIVWYTTELPYGFGPWKLYGLPGLIVEASDIDNKYSFTLKTIQVPEKTVYSQVYFLKNENKISKTYQEYIAEKKKQHEKLAAGISPAWDSRMANVSFKAAETRDIEF
jgi:GLPGLI family protein